MTTWQLLLITSATLATTGCPAPTPARPGDGACSDTGPHACGNDGIHPDACGAIDGNPVGRKVYAFLVASEELDRTSAALEDSIHHACVQMAGLLDVAVDGGTKRVCGRVARALDDNLQVSVRTESRLVTRYVPPQCHTDVAFTAGVVADCEGHASADPAMADVSAECRATAEIRSSLHTTCTEATVEVVRDDVTVLDDTRFQRALTAIDAGLPTLLGATKKLELAAQAVARWADTGRGLVDSSGELVGELGVHAVCVASQLAGIYALAPEIQARFTVSIEVSAEVSASAGATPQ
jgi:hypothetical protein